MLRRAASHICSMMAYKSGVDHRILMKLTMESTKYSTSVYNSVITKELRCAASHIWRINLGWTIYVDIRRVLNLTMDSTKYSISVYNSVITKTLRR